MDASAKRRMGTGLLQLLGTRMYVRRTAFCPNPAGTPPRLRAGGPEGPGKNDPCCSVAPLRGPGDGVDPRVTNPRLVDEHDADARSQWEEILRAVQEVRDSVHSLGKLD